MRHRFFSLLLACVLIFSVIPNAAFAAENIASTESIITLEDGSYLEVIIISTDMRASEVKSGSKVLNHRSSEGELNWQAVLSASFTYTGTTSTCTSASCSVTIYDDTWYQVSKSTSHSGNTATTQLTMGQKVLGVTISKPSYTLTLSCDANGNLS